MCLVILDREAVMVEGSRPIGSVCMLDKEHPDGQTNLECIFGWSLGVDVRLLFSIYKYIGHARVGGSPLLPKFPTPGQIYRA